LGATIARYDKQRTSFRPAAPTKANLQSISQEECHIVDNARVVGFIAVLSRKLANWLAGLSWQPLLENSRTSGKCFGIAVPVTALVTLSSKLYANPIHFHGDGSVIF
jgi:hypothetical protein